jgi:hypothetical protein
MDLALALKGPEQPRSASNDNQRLSLQDDTFCAFLPERDKKSGYPVNPV